MVRDNVRKASKTIDFDAFCELLRTKVLWNPVFRNVTGLDARLWVHTGPDRCLCIIGIGLERIGAWVRAACDPGVEVPLTAGRNLSKCGLWGATLVLGLAKWLEKSPGDPGTHILAQNCVRNSV